MSCAPSTENIRNLPQGLLATLSDEGFRLFFPLAAIYAALFPLLWVLAFGFDLPLAKSVPPSIWHGYEMLVGAFGAALIGFLTTAAPEWTDTEPMRGGALWVLAAIWAVGRLVGVLGWDGMSAIAGVADLVWMTALCVYLLRLSIRRRTDRLVAFIFWLCVLIGCTAAARISILVGDLERAQDFVHLIGFGFLGLLGLALARITVPVTNLVLDPTEETSPFRPHPGRLHLASGLVLIAMCGQILGFSDQVSGFLVFAAGAAFMDRVAEAFIGREALRAEILILAGSAALAGIGLMMTGAAMLGAPWGVVTGLHLAFMGGLGLGVLTVFCIAGLLHTDQQLGLSRVTQAAALMLVFATCLRIAPDMGFEVPGPFHAAASLAWALAFLLWLWSYWPALSSLSSTKH
jgi:uncharacterized protein involved in response to NO